MIYAITRSSIIEQIIYYTRISVIILIAVGKPIFIKLTKKALTKLGKLCIL